MNIGSIKISICLHCIFQTNLFYMPHKRLSIILFYLSTIVTMSFINRYSILGPTSIHSNPTFLRYTPTPRAQIVSFGSAKRIYCIRQIGYYGQVLDTFLFISCCITQFSLLTSSLQSTCTLPVSSTRRISTTSPRSAARCSITSEGVSFCKINPNRNRENHKQTD